MSRLGCLLLAGFLIVIAGFALIVKRGHAPLVSAAPEQSSPAPIPASVAKSVGQGALVIPVSGVQPAQLTDTWGDARGDGTREHHAIDIMAPRGTPVVAAAAGTVEKIFESRNGGHTVYVRRDDAQWLDYYAHLDSYAPNLAEGQRVGQGQLIGAVGSTGDASPEAPHLHYEIKHMAAGEKWWQGTEINPYEILRR